MTPEQAAAYVNSQVACATIEAAGMTALNMQRESLGLSMAYEDDAFDALINKYGIHHNTVLSLFQNTEG